jgi:hypothetical protein
MSEISALAHEYRAASQLSETMNRALIGVKKSEGTASSDEVLDSGELIRARDSLADIVRSLVAALSSRRDDGLRTSRDIPPAVIQTLLKRHSGELNYYIDDLKGLESHLTAAERLPESDLILLDQIVTTIDKETAQVFRRLMRK